MAAGIGNISIGFVADTTRFMVGSEKVAAQLKAMGGPVGKLSGVFKGMTTPLGLAGMGLAGITTGAAMVVATFNRLHETATQLDTIGDTADNIGMGANALMKLQFAAEHSGSSADSMDAALKSMTLTIGKARAGSKSAIATFTKLGIGIDEISNVSPDQAFSMIATGLKKINSSYDQSVLAKGIFGKGGVDLIGTLNRGGEGLDKLAKKFDILGPKINAVDWNNIGDLDKATKDADAAIKGLEQTMAAKLAPTMTKFQHFKTGIATTINANPEAITNTPGRVIRKGGALGAALDMTLGKIYDAFAAKGKKISDMAPASAERGAIPQSRWQMQSWVSTAPVEFGTASFERSEKIRAGMDMAEKQLAALEEIAVNTRTDEALP